MEEVVHTFCGKLGASSVSVPNFRGLTAVAKNLTNPLPKSWPYLQKFKPLASFSPLGHLRRECTGSLDARDECPNGGFLIERTFTPCVVPIPDGQSLAAGHGIVRWAIISAHRPGSSASWSMNSNPTTHQNHLDQVKCKSVVTNP